MKIKEYILMSLRDLWRRKGRTILTSLGITIGTFLIVTMMGIVVGLKGFMSSAVNDGDDARRIVVEHYRDYSQDDYDEETMTDADKFEKEYFKKLDNDFIDKMKDTGKTETVIGTVYCQMHSVIFNNKEYKGDIPTKGYNIDANLYPDFKIQQVRHDKEDDTLKPLKYGKFIEEEYGEALIGEKLLDAFGLSSDDVLNKEIEMTVDNKEMNKQKISKKVKVVGIIDKNFDDSDSLILSVKDAAELQGLATLQKDYFETKGYDRVTVVADNLSDVESLSDKVKELDYYATSSIEMANEINSGLTSMNKGFLMLGVVILVVAAIGIVNTMGMAVAERTKSIGVMKSVGATSSAIRLMFLIQASLIGLLGGIFGVLIGTGINKLIEGYATSKISKESLNLAISIGLPWYYIVLILIFAMALALVSGIYPASKAAKLDPVNALRR